MPFDGSGNFNRVMNWVNDALANIKIKADRHDSEDDNFASGLSNTLTKDGQSQPTANIPMNGKRLINLGAPVNPNDGASKSYVDAIRSFSTAITLTGAVPEARIGFSVADIGFGSRVAGTPVGTLNRFVWNDKPDLSGTDIAALDDTGKLQLAKSLMFGAVDVGFGARPAGTPVGSLDRFAWNAVQDMSGADVATLDDKGRMALGATAPVIPANSRSAATLAGEITFSGGYSLGFNAYFDSVAAGYKAATTGWGTLIALDTTTGLWSLNRSSASAAANAAYTMTQLLGITAAGSFTFLTGTVLVSNIDSLALVAGFSQANLVNDGNKAAGTFTPLPAGGNIRFCNNAGAWTLAADGNTTTAYTLVLLISNVAGAGVISNSGWTKFGGDPFTTTVGHYFMCYITKIGGVRTCTVEALQ